MAISEETGISPGFQEANWKRGEFRYLVQGIEKDN